LDCKAQQYWVNNILNFTEYDEITNTYKKQIKETYLQIFQQQIGRLDIGLRLGNIFGRSTDLCYILGTSQPYVQLKYRAILS